MRSNDLDVVEGRLREVDAALSNVQREVIQLARAIETLRQACGDEREFLKVLSNQRRPLNALQSIVRDFPLIKQMRRRVPQVRDRLRREEGDKKGEKIEIAAHAEDVATSLEDILRKFMK